MPAATPPSFTANALDASLNKARSQQGASVSSFLATVLVCFASFAAQLLLFLLLRHRLHDNFAPRPATRRWYSWLISEASSVWHECFSAGYHYDSVKTIGPDAFFHMRYLTVLLKIFIPLAVVLPSILIPLHVVHGRNEAGNIAGLDRLSWANVSSSRTDRYWAHTILAVLASAYVCLVIWAELELYCCYMHNFWLDNDSPRADTLLIVSIPSTYRPDTGIKHLLRGFHDKIDYVWRNKDGRALVQRIKEHRSIAQKLEAAETAFLRRSLKAWKAEPEEARPTTDEGKRRLISPCRRLIWPQAPFKGQKVDEIGYWRVRYLQAVAEVEEERRRLQNKPCSGSAFVRFTHPASAHALRQLVVHYNPGTVIPVCLFCWPGEVVWENVSIDWVHSIYRSVIVKGCMMMLVCLFAVPVAFAGTLSQITSLSSIVPGLGWLDSLPEWLLGVIQGVIPPAILACLLWSLAAILRKLAVVQGAPSRQVVEELVQNYYFRFLFAQLFLIIVMTSGFVSVKSKIEQGLIATLDSIMRAVPQASNYFLTYMLLQAFSISGSALLQPGDIAQKLILGPVFDRTPTQQKMRAGAPERVEWGTHFPTYAALACVGFIYSLISPLILFAEVFCFALILIIHRYNADHGNKRRFDPGGCFYPHAIKQLLGGLYGMQSVLFCLLLLVTNSEERLACIGQAVIIGINAVCIFFFHRVVRSTFNSLLHYLPASDFPENQFGKIPPLSCNCKDKKGRQSPSKKPWPALEDNIQLLKSEPPQNEAKGKKSLPPGNNEEEVRKNAWKTSVYLSTDHALEYPLVRIPQDPVGLSKLEIEDTIAFSPLLRISDGEAILEISGKVSLTASSRT